MVCKEREWTLAITPMQLCNSSSDPLVIDCTPEKCPLVLPRQAKYVKRDSESLFVGYIVVIFLVVDVNHKVGVTWIHINSE